MSPVPDPRLERSLHHQPVQAAGEPSNLLPAQHRVQLRIRAHLPGDHQGHESRVTLTRVVMQDHIIIRLVSGLLGRMTITAAYFVCLQVSAATCHVSRVPIHVCPQYASELMPTVLRGRGVALCEVFGGVAILLSPMIVHLVSAVTQPRLIGV